MNPMTCEKFDDLLGAIERVTCNYSDYVEGNLRILQLLNSTHHERVGWLAFPCLTMSIMDMRGTIDAYANANSPAGE